MVDVAIISALGVGGVAALFAIDRFALFAESKGWIYWRRTRPKPDGGAALGELIEVFQPNVRFAQQEKQRLEAGTEYATSEDDFDLDAGRVVIHGPDWSSRSSHPAGARVVHTKKDQARNNL